MKVAALIAILAFNAYATYTLGTGYNLDVDTDGSNITFSLTLDSTSSVTINNGVWVGIGFGTSMTNTDIIICRFLANQLYCYDCFAPGHGQPPLDTH